MKRVTYEVRWEDDWVIYCDGKWVRRALYKVYAVKRAAQLALKHWKRTGEPTELIVKNKNGRIGKGKSSRRSYGRDPEKSRG